MKNYLNKVTFAVMKRQLMLYPLFMLVFYALSLIQKSVFDAHFAALITAVYFGVSAASLLIHFLVFAGTAAYAAWQDRSK